MNRELRISGLLALAFVSFWITQRVFAGSEIGEGLKEKPVSQLIQELKSDRELIRARAAEELGNRKSRMAVPYFIEALKDEDLAVRSRACWALGKIEDPIAVPSLIEKLRDKEENWAVKKEAGESLVKIGDPRAFQPLLDALRDECKTERKIETIYPPLRHGYISPDESIERIFSDALKDFIEKAEDKQLYVRSLFEYLNDSRTPKIFRYRLGIILGGLGEKKAAPTLIECLEKSDRGEMRVLSAWLLGEMGVREAIPHLKQALKDDFVDPGHKVSKDVGEGMIEGCKRAEGKAIFSAMEIISEGDYYRVRAYTVRNSAAAALQSLGIKVVKSGNGYKVIE